MSQKQNTDGIIERIIAMIDDDSIIIAVDPWRAGKNAGTDASKALRLIKPLVGKCPQALKCLRRQWTEENGRHIGEIVLPSLPGPTRRKTK